MFVATIAGASFGGLATALQLQRRGVVPFSVLDASDGPPAAQVGANAVGLWTNAWWVLDALGVGERARECCRCRADVFRVGDMGSELAGGRWVRRAFAAPAEHEFRRVRSGDVMRAMRDALTSASIEYGGRIEECLDGIGRRSGEPTLVVGADGADSFVRRQLLRRDATPRYAGYVAHRGIARIPWRAPNMPDAPSAAALDAPGCVALLLGRGDGTRIGVQRMDDERVFWFGCENVRQSQLDALPSPLERMASLTAAPSRLSGSMRAAVQQLLQATPSEDASTARCRDLFPPVFQGVCPARNVLAALVGDAAHPCTPNLSQGVGLALEDGYALANLLSDAYAARRRSATDLAVVLRAYQRQRARRVATVMLRSRLVGTALQMELPPPLVALRNRLAIPLALRPQAFVSHARPPIPAQ